MARSVGVFNSGVSVTDLVLLTTVGWLALTPSGHAVISRLAQITGGAAEVGAGLIGTADSAASVGRTLSEAATAVADTAKSIVSVSPTVPAGSGATAPAQTASGPAAQSGASSVYASVGFPSRPVLERLTDISEWGEGRHLTPGEPFDVPVAFQHRGAGEWLTLSLEFIPASWAWLVGAHGGQPPSVRVDKALGVNDDADYTLYEAHIDGVWTGPLGLFDMRATLWNSATRQVGETYKPGAITASAKW